MKNAKRKVKKNMNERLRNIKGITLISLVITVIILLILAAVAINLAVDSDGLFKKTGDATNSWNDKVAEEQTTLQDLFEQAGIETPTEITTDLPAGWNDETVSAVAKQGSRTAPIPNGFVASSVEGEDSISGGLVIYETTTPVTDTNHDTALTDYNQYVWIPVDNINDMIMCQTHGASVTLDTTTLQCPTCGGDTKLAGKLYLGTSEEIIISSGAHTYKYTMDFTKNDQTYDANSGYREPAIVTGNSTGDGTSYDGATDNYHGLESATAFLAQLQDDFDNMAQSVAKYKGFYISRYEIGENGASKKGQTVLNVANMWYGLYNTLRTAPNATTSTYSQMIWRKSVRSSNKVYWK